MKLILSIAKRLQADHNHSETGDGLLATIYDLGMNHLYTWFIVGCIGDVATIIKWLLSLLCMIDELEPDLVDYLVDGY